MHVDAIQINLNRLVNSCCFFSIDTDTDISKFDGNLILAASPENKFQNIAETKRQFKHILFTQMCKKDKTNYIMKSSPTNRYNII